MPIECPSSGVHTGIPTRLGLEAGVTQHGMPDAVTRLDAFCTVCAPRVVIVCAHPDDEVIGAGGRLPYLGDVHVVHVTDGAPVNGRDAAALGFPTRDAYARARAEEKRRAMALAGVGPTHLHEVGLCDQEASYALVSLARHLAKLFAMFDPAIVLTHAYEGGHPDHDATAFAVHAAVAELRAQGRDCPVIVEMTAYHAGGGAAIRGEFLPGMGSGPRTVVLHYSERVLKRRMVECYATQQRTLALFPTDVERFRLAPAYDFAAPPHDGRLFYEWFDWGMTGDRWRALVREAHDGLREGACDNSYDNPHGNPSAEHPPRPT